MNEADLLQERLERLETGESIETCLAGLPEQEARLLRLVAAIHQVQVPEQENGYVAAQYASFLSAAAKEMEGNPRTQGPTRVPALLPLDRLRSWLDRLLSRRELAAGLVFVSAVVLVLVLWAGASRWSARNAGVADAPPTAAVGGVATGVAGVPPTAAAANAATVDAYPGPGATAQAGESNGDDPAPETGPGTAPAEPAPAEIAVDEGYYTYMPLVANPLMLNPQTAAVQDVSGIVEIQASDGSWTAVQNVASVTAGQRVRSGTLSGATIAFFDGSQALLGPESEIAIDELDAQLPEAGRRTVVLTQWRGESEHSVEFRNDNGSRYEVKTPSGSGLARGTRFRVLVTPSLLAHFIVIEGKVDVSGLNVTVPVIAGQLSTIIAGRPPAEPTFRISGEGHVSQTGTVWIIAGQSFQMHEHTIIRGNPQVGDLVFVEGHLLADGSRMADRISLRQRASSNRFSLTGAVEAIGDATWTVAGQRIAVSSDTVIDRGVKVGDTVNVEGAIQPGGTLTAGRITRISQTPGLPFHFTGVVQERGGATWIISGQSISVDDDTERDGDIAVGDLVVVRGWILDDNTWRASAIKRSDAAKERSFAITGAVQSIEPWRVAGIAFGIRAWTVIEPGIEVGDVVRVRGVILEDGRLVASFIEPAGREPVRVIVFVGIVSSIDPWIVNGIPLVVSDGTAIGGNISVGMLVRVEVQLRPDGTWVVNRLRAINAGFGLGCLTLSTVVLGIDNSQLVLRHWPAIRLDDDDNKIEIRGEIKVDSVVTLPLCFRFDGTIFIGNIIVIYQPIIVIAPPPPAPAPPRPQPPRGNHNSNHNG